MMGTPTHTWPDGPTLTNLRLGFLGTGTITAALVTGICAHRGLASTIHVSPRNATVARRLATEHPEVTVACSNQEVLDRSDIVFLAVRPQVALEALSSLRFRPDHHAISLVALFSLDRIAGLVRPAGRTVCAAPLPMVASHLGPTPIYPPDPVAANIFARLGAAVEVQTEHELQALWASTAVMASFFTLQDSLAAWLVAQGIPESRARTHVATMFDGLARVPRERAEPFSALAKDFMTKGGLNEQCAMQLSEAGAFEAWNVAVSAVLARITAGAS